MLITILLITLIAIVLVKWIIIGIIFPFQCAYGQVRRRWTRDTMPLYAKLMAGPYWLWERIFRDGWSRFMLYNVGLIPSCHIRRAIYKALGAQVDKNVVFHFRTEIRTIYNLKVGKGTIIGDNALLDARNKITMGENVNLSSNVSIYTEQHDHRDPYFGCNGDINKSVNIADRVWIGSNVIVLPGVNIGEGAVCCAGSVITKDVEPYAVVAGIPAKKVNERPRNLQYEFDGTSCRLY